MVLDSHFQNTAVEDTEYREYRELVDFMARLNSQIFDDPLRTVDQHTADFHLVSPDLPAIQIRDQS